VTWRIERGLLVAREGRGKGYLRIAVERLDDAETRASAPPPPGRVRLRLEAAVANFYPWLRGTGWFARFGTWLYSQTQLRIHVLVTNGFLRSLARLDLEESAVGRFAEHQRGVRHEKDGAVTVGDTPWAVIAGLAAAAAVCVAALALWLTRD